MGTAHRRLSWTLRSGLGRNPVVLAIMATFAIFPLASGASPQNQVAGQARSIAGVAGVEFHPPLSASEFAALPPQLAPGTVSYHYLIDWTPAARIPFGGGFVSRAQPQAIVAEIADDIHHNADGLLRSLAKQGDPEKQSVYLQRILAIERPFVVSAVKTYDGPQAVAEANYRQLLSYWGDRASLIPPPLARTVEFSTPRVSAPVQAAAVGGWKPASGGWWFYFEFCCTVAPRPGFFVYDLAFHPTFSSASQLSAYGDSNDGFEIGAAFVWIPGKPNVSGFASSLYSWFSDFPARYIEFLTVDDSLVHYDIGTSEAENLRVYPYSAGVRIADQNDYFRLNPHPKVFISGQYDLGMLPGCPNSGADACFYSDGGCKFTPAKAFEFGPAEVGWTNIC